MKVVVFVLLIVVLVQVLLVVQVVEAPVINLNDTSNNTSGGGEVEQPTEKDASIGLVFWTVLIILLAGIIVAGVVIVKSLNRRRKFTELANVASLNSVNLATSPVKPTGSE